MPAKPAASQVCNVAPCNHTCRCDEYNFWRCDVISPQDGNCEVRLILSVNGQKTIANVFDCGTPIVFCMNTYFEDADLFRHPCPSGNGWCHYWQGQDTCTTVEGFEHIPGQEYCVKRIN